MDGRAAISRPDALTAITAQLDGFHGQSSFKTWAAKFVVFGMSATAARRFCRISAMSLDQEGWDRLQLLAAVEELRAWPVREQPTCARRLLAARWPWPPARVWRSSSER